MKSITRQSPLQQEMYPNWITGLVDGEGSFMILFTPNSKFNTNWEVRPSFALSLKMVDKNILLGLKDYFNCGNLPFCKTDSTYKYEVRSLQDLHCRVIPHFDKYPLLIKRKEFLVFRKVVFLMKAKKHLMSDGLKEISRLVSSINRGRDKKNFPSL
jgi:hypothetical protein